MVDIEKSTPEFVRRDGMIVDADYVQWLNDVKARFREGQARAAVKVNTEMLRFYWSIGRDLVALRAETRWGSGVVKQFAFDMREAFPAATGFSFSNVKYMKQWYSFYAGNEKSQRTIGQIAKSQQAVGQIGYLSTGTSGRAHSEGTGAAKERKRRKIDLLIRSECAGR